MIEHGHPLDALQVLFSVEASDSEEATVFTQAEAEHALVDNFSLVHGIIYWLLPFSTDTFCHSHSKDTVGLLIIKQVSLLLHASKGKVKRVVASMVFISEVNRVLNQKSFIA